MVKQKSNYVGKRNYGKYFKLAQTGYGIAKRAYPYIKQASKFVNVRRVGSMSGVARQYRRSKIANVLRGPSKSAGFIKTKKKVVRSGKKNTMLNKGAYRTYEKGGVVSCTTANQTYYIGHTCAPQELSVEIVVRSIIKALFEKMGYPIKQYTDTLTWMAAGDRIEIKYRNGYDSTDAQTVQSFAWGAAYTANNFVSVIYSYWIGNWSANKDFNLIDITFFPAATVNGIIAATRINLYNGKLELHYKSSLKIQNRSVGGSLDDNEDAVDNVPLYAKGYSGNGTGTDYVGNTSGSLPFIADKGNGLIFHTGSDTVGTLETPFAQLFKGVKKEGRAVLEPGHIKTSVLELKKKINLSKFVSINIRQNLDANPLVPLGSFRFYGFEKILNADEAIDFKYAYEVNHCMGARFYEGKDNTYTTMDFLKL